MYFAMLFVALNVAGLCLNAASFVFNPQPPYGRREVQGPNPEDLSQTYFFAAQSSDVSKTGVPDSLQFSFQIGSFFGPVFTPSENFIVVSGTKGGVPFSKTLVARNDTIKVTDYSGDWGIGKYKGTKDWRSVVSTVNSPQQNVTGSIKLDLSSAPPAWGCGPNTGTNMEVLRMPSSTAAEIDMYKNTNFAHFASGKASVQLTIDGSLLEFSGPYEAETSFGKPYQAIYSRFIYGFTTVGPYSLVIWDVAPTGEPTKFATIGYLSKDNCLIVNKCNTIASAARGTKVSPSGSFDALGLTTPVPGELQIDFTGKQGKHYRFNVETKQAAGAVLPGAGSTASSLATVRGGRVGGRQYESNMFVLYFAGEGNTFL